MDNPIVSVITVAKGSCLFLEETIASVLGQTFTDFEWIFIDGGIGESAKSILMQYAFLDKRIKIFKQTEAGLSPARNQAFAMSTGKYCAVADSDDLYFPNRLEKQVIFLENHPEISLCGSWIKTIGEDHNEVWKTPIVDATIRSSLIFHNPIHHSSVMWRRKDILNSGLLYELDSAEDYDLWLRLSKFIRFANIPEVLVHYRIHPNQHSIYSAEKGIVQKNTLFIRLLQINALEIKPTDQEIDTHEKLSRGEFQQDDDFVRKAEAWLLKLRTANHKRQLYPEPQFNQLLATRWYSVCLNTKPTQNTLIKFLISPLNYGLDNGIPQKKELVLGFLRILKHFVTKHLPQEFG